MSSELRKTRRKTAVKVEDEIFTLQTELNNIEKISNTLDFDGLKKLEIDQLISLRNDVQSIQYRIRRFNERINNLASN